MSDDTQHSAAHDRSCVCWQRRPGCGCYLWDQDCPDYVSPSEMVYESSWPPAHGERVREIAATLRPTPSDRDGTARAAAIIADEREALRDLIEEERRGWNRRGSGYSIEVADRILASDVWRNRPLDVNTKTVNILRERYEQLLDVERRQGPITDEWEALAEAAWGEHSIGFVFESDDQEYGEKRAYLAGFEAGFRRQEPPTDDEREALILEDGGSEQTFNSPISLFYDIDGVMHMVYESSWEDVALRFAAGFRRQGPITDEWEYGLTWEPSVTGATEPQSYDGCETEAGAWETGRRLAGSGQRLKVWKRPVRPAVQSIPAGPWEPVEPAERGR